MSAIKGLYKHQKKPYEKQQSSKSRDVLVKEAKPLEKGLYKRLSI